MVKKAVRERMEHAGKWLRWLCTGYVITLFQRIPYVGNLLAMAGSVINIIAMVKLRHVSAGYRQALFLTLWSIGLLLLASIAWAASLVTIAFLGAALVLFVVYMVIAIRQTHCFCAATAELMREIREDSVARMWDWLWKISAVCVILSTGD